MQNPELMDPIYGELLKESKSYADIAAKLLAEAEATKGELEVADVKTGNAKAIKARYYGKMKEAEKARQKQVYYELRARSRKKEDREKYLEAFLANKPWPDPEEYEGYKTQNRLSKSSKNWETRTKKWSDRLAGIKKAQLAEQKSQESTSSHGGGESNGSSSGSSH